MIDKPIAVALLAAGGSALIYGATWAQAQDAAMMHAGTQCLAAEKIAFNCELPKKIASVCKTPTHLVFRYGNPGSPDVVVASDGTDGKSLQSFAHTNSREEGSTSITQQHLRFKNGEDSYMVFASELEHPDHSRSTEGGLAVFLGWNDSIDTNCVRMTTTRADLDDAIHREWPTEVEGAVTQGLY